MERFNEEKYTENDTKHSRIKKTADPRLTCSWLKSSKAGQEGQGRRFWWRNSACGSVLPTLSGSAEPKTRRTPAALRDPLGGQPAPHDVTLRPSRVFHNFELPLPSVHINTLYKLTPLSVTYRVRCVGVSTSRQTPVCVSVKHLASHQRVHSGEFFPPRDLLVSCDW